MFTPITGKYFSRRKVLFSYLITYLIIITVLFLVIGSSSYFNIIRVEEEKAEMQMNEAVNKAVEVMDANLRDVLNIQSTLYTNPEVSRLRKLEENFQTREFMRFLDMSNILSRHTSTSQFLDRITIYFHHNQLFVASDMLDNRPEIFYKLKFPYNKINYEQWRSQQIHHDAGIFYVPQDSPNGYVNLYYRLPITDRGVTVIAGIKVGQLIDSLGLGDLYNDSAVILTDSKGNILYSNREIGGELIDLSGKAPDSSNVLIDDISYQWCSEKLSLLDWDISYFVSTNDIYAESRRNRQSIIWSYLLVLASSVFLAVIFSKRISDPVTSLLNLIDGWSSVSSPNTEEVDKNNHKYFGAKPLNYVLRKVSDMSNDYSRLESRVHEYKEISKEFFYNRLLKGEIIPATEIRMIKEDSILNFSYYTVALARFISYESKSIEIAMFAASEMFSNMQDEGLYFCKTAFDRFAIVISRNKLLEKSQVAELIESFHNKIYFDSLVSLRWGIGDTVTNYDQIFVSYRNAEYALYSHNMDILDSEFIVWYDTDRQKNRLTYNFDDAHRIYALICNEDSQGAIKEIKGLVDRNIEILEASRGQLNRFISMLSETTLLLVSKLPDLDVHLEREIEGILRQMRRTDNLDTIMEQISIVVEKLCLSVSTRNNNRNRHLVHKITTYIDENYRDSTLSLAIIAEDIRLTETYISSFFKQNKGISIHNYIQQKRMIKAAELLEETDLAIAEIVQQIGYNNTNTFYKAFKRYYGMTPRSYKESKQSNMEETSIKQP